MGKKIPGGGPTKTITVRIPAETHAELVEVATAKGIDLSAIVNVVLAEARPSLAKWLRDFRDVMNPARRATRDETILQLFLSRLMFSSTDSGRYARAAKGKSPMTPQEEASALEYLKSYAKEEHSAVDAERIESLARQAIEVHQQEIVRTVQKVNKELEEASAADEDCDPVTTEEVLREAKVLPDNRARNRESKRVETEEQTPKP